MFPNVLNTQSLHYYNKYMTEYRHQYEEILKRYSPPKSKGLVYQSADILSTPPYFVENILNGKAEKDESPIESPLSSEYNDETSQKSPSANNHLMDARDNDSPPLSPPAASQDNAQRCTAGRTCSTDVPKDYSVYATQNPYRHMSSFGIDRMCSSPKTASSSNGTVSPADTDGMVNRDPTPPAGEPNSYPEERYQNTSSEKFGTFSFFPFFFLLRISKNNESTFDLTSNISYGTRWFRERGE